MDAENEGKKVWRREIKGRGKGKDVEPGRYMRDGGARLKISFLMD
jgi:hypothetical protein